MVVIVSRTFTQEQCWPCHSRTHLEESIPVAVRVCSATLGSMKCPTRSSSRFSTSKRRSFVTHPWKLKSPVSRPRLFVEYRTIFIRQRVANGQVISRRVRSFDLVRSTHTPVIPWLAIGVTRC